MSPFFFLARFAAAGISQKRASPAKKDLTFSNLDPAKEADFFSFDSSLLTGLEICITVLRSAGIRNVLF